MNYFVTLTKLGKIINFQITQPEQLKYCYP